MRINCPHCGALIDTLEQNPETGNNNVEGRYDPGAELEAAIDFALEDPAYAEALRPLLRHIWAALHAVGTNPDREYKRGRVHFCTEMSRSG